MLPQLKHDLQLPKTRDEAARSRFAMNLRGYVMNDVANMMNETYHEKVAPAYQRQSGHEVSDGDNVHDLMMNEQIFKFYSSIRYNAQEMCHRAVIPTIERQRDFLKDVSARMGAKSEVGGTLTLNPDLKVPNYVENIDVHLMPGSYVTGDQDGDARAGALYDGAISIFAFGQMGDQMDDIGWSMSKYIRHMFPDFKPKKILDVGCTIGHNTLPLAQEFTEAEVHAVDVAAPGLRYAHARAQSLGVPVHFSQQNGENLDFEDNSFDLVFSSMFLHELPLESIKNFLKEAHRVLRPGGLMLNMELPPNNNMHAYDQFYLDWDSHYNNEPFYKTFRDQDAKALCAESGFNADSFFDAAVPQYTLVSKEEFIDLMVLNPDAEMLSKTGLVQEDTCHRYAFGAWKQAAASAQA